MRRTLYVYFPPISFLFTKHMYNINILQINGSHRRKAFASPGIAEPSIDIQYIQYLINTSICPPALTPQFNFLFDPVRPWTHWLASLSQSFSRAFVCAMRHGRRRVLAWALGIERRAIGYMPFLSDNAVCGSGR
jgi:hypothetical protein